MEEATGSVLSTGLGVVMWVMLVILPYLQSLCRRAVLKAVEETSCFSLSCVSYCL